MQNFEVTISLDNMILHMIVDINNSKFVVLKDDGNAEG